MKTFDEWADDNELCYFSDSERGVAEKAWEACLLNFRKQHQVQYDHSDGWCDATLEEYNSAKHCLTLAKENGGDYYRRHYQVRIIYVENNK